MKLSKRILTKWRKEALTKITAPAGVESLAYTYSRAEEMQKQILALTQELLDIKLLEEKP